MPSERTLAVLKTREFLQNLIKNTETPEYIRHEAKWLLRHYPDATDIKIVAQAMQTMRSSLPAGPVFCIDDPFCPTLSKYFPQEALANVSKVQENP
ncbi:BPSL0761 family protein [Chitinilyticum aquatile]|uniref:BPSL0761 family protein n=1 Tax=Chitinilyticum aquatile TaxID=362520 RepID=UPI00357103E2